MDTHRVWVTRFNEGMALGARGPDPRENSAFVPEGFNEGMALGARGLPR